MNQETDTKPLALPTSEATRLVLCTTFCADRIVEPPTMVRVPSAGIQIGRQVGAGLRLDDARVSSRHAVARSNTEGVILLEDQRSKNGTFVNGQRVESARLASGDVVSLGDTCLVVAREPALEGGSAMEGLAGGSAEMRRIRASVSAIGPTALTVLLIAETGCGKEMVARALHRESKLSGDFVAVNCAAIPENLFESQFFGHKAGAFTGAATAHLGYFRAAMGGTLFLDEIGELPLPLQSKLLRVIQERAVVPLGSTTPISCPVRIVAATNRNLEQEVKRGAFRGDLLARLFEAEVPLPPLRDRREDILTLFNVAAGHEVAMKHSLAEALLLHDWPYNVREVFAVSRALAIEHQRGTLMTAEEFRRRIDGFRGQERRERTVTAARRPDLVIDADQLARLLTEKSGNVTEVAREVGRSRRQVYRWIAKYGLAIPPYRA